MKNKLLEIANTMTPDDFNEHKQLNSLVYRSIETDSFIALFDTVVSLKETHPSEYEKLYKYIYIIKENGK